MTDNGKTVNVMYAFAFCFRGFGSVIGRTWSDFNKVVRVLDSTTDKTIVYVHNLSYEWQYLKSVLSFTTEDIFILDKRKILKCCYKNIEFRCSYLLTNMSLQDYTNKMMVKHVKRSGIEFDYSKKRTSDTFLTDEELLYIYHDVVGLAEALEVDMEKTGDNLITIPMTSTGYVRRDVKKSLVSKKRSGVDKLLPDIELYMKLREAFRGGNTHANRYYSGSIIGPVYSYDRTSSYPDVQCNKKFPVTPFRYKGDLSYIELEKLIHTNKALLMRVVFLNIELRDIYYGAPYISLSKTRNSVDCKMDNGRILKARQLETTITDIDLEIIIEEYKFDKAIFFDVSISNYGVLPKEMTDVAKKYYKDKTELKNVEGKEVLYVKSKNLLNGIYGMSAENVVKNEYLYDSYLIRENESIELNDRLESGNKRAFLPYQWGVWTTAHARMELECGIRLAGYDFVYCDTDSVKSKKEIDFSYYNKEHINKSIETNSFATANGTTYYMGVYEEESLCEKFITMGAKKYAGVYKNGELFVTISGVRKREGAAELKEKGGLDNFKKGFTFKKSAGMKVEYCDTTGYYIIDGNRQYVPTHAILTDTVYTLGITSEYEQLLQDCADLLY